MATRDAVRLCRDTRANLESLITADLLLDNEMVHITNELNYQGVASLGKVIDGVLYNMETIDHQHSNSAELDLITDAGSGIIITAAERSKLAAIEAGATGDQSNAEIKTAYEANADTNAFTDADESKLDGIEAGADVTDTANVTAAGALMDSEVTNLADVKAFDTTDYATAAQGSTADSAQQPPAEGAFVDGDKTKLDGIETAATADQTDAEIKTAYEANADTNAFTDAEKADLGELVTLVPATKTANYTLVLGDADLDTYLRMNVTGASTLTVPPNSSVAFAVGTAIPVFNVSASDCVVTAGAGVTINSANTTVATVTSTLLIKVGTDEWDMA